MNPPLYLIIATVLAVIIGRVLRRSWEDSDGNLHGEDIALILILSLIGGAAWIVVLPVATVALILGSLIFLGRGKK